MNATFALPPAGRAQIVRWLCEDQIDLAIGPYDGDLPSPVEFEPLLKR